MSRLVTVEPDRRITRSSLPNDPSFSRLWGLHNSGHSAGTVDVDIDAVEAWDITTGSRAVVVAVIDTGIDYRHADLAANMWRNPREVAGDRIDNDGNGFIDDVFGWDFANHDADPFDDEGHGTHVAGTIGAIGNNGVGVVGVAWNVSLMALKFLDAEGNGTTSGAIAVLNYATRIRRDFGVNVVATNNSWGGGGASAAMRSAIVAGESAGIVCVAAAGNDTSNNDSMAFHPANDATVAADGGRLVTLASDTWVTRPAILVDAGDSLALAASIRSSSGGVLLAGTIGDGSHGSRDVDFSSCILAGGQTLTIDIDAMSLSGGSTLDSYVRVFNASGQQVAMNDDALGSLDSYLAFRPAVAGTYFIGISGYGNGGYSPSRAGSGRGGSTGNYRVLFTVAALAGGTTRQRVAGRLDSGLARTVSAFAVYGVNWEAAVSAATTGRARRTIAACG